jgi:hypothetical protein
MQCRSAHYKAFASNIQKYNGKLEYSAEKKRSKVKKNVKVVLFAVSADLEF